MSQEERPGSRMAKVVAPDAGLTLADVVLKQKKQPISVGTVLGLLVGVGLFLGSILMATDNFAMFWSVPSLLMVLGGTLANAFISYQAGYVIRALMEACRIMAHARINESIFYAESRKVIQWARIVQQGGVLALESHVKTTEAHDHLLRYGVQLVIDGNKPAVIRDLITNAIHSAYERGSRHVEILRNMASTSPAFGMIGTLVGLIIMLDSLGKGADSSQLGPGLAMALLTTLYGVLVARLVFQPAADKTQQRLDIARFRSSLVCEALVMIAQEKSPRFIEDRINSFLDPEVLHSLGGTRKKGS